MFKVIWDFEERDWISVLPLPRFNQKYGREEEKCGERKCWISATVIPNSSAQFCYPCVECLKWKGKNKNKNKKNCQTNCGNAIAEIGV